MDVINIFLILLSVATFVLAFFVFLKNRKSSLNFSFGALVSIAGLWPLSIALFREADTISAALFWDKAIYLCAILIPPAILAFAHLFVDAEFKFKLWRLFVYLGPFLFLMPLLLFTNLWVKKVVLTDWGNTVELGPAYLIWIVWFVGYVIWGFIILFKKYRKSSGLIKMQLRYILLSLAFPAIGGAPFNVIAPLFGYYRLIWIGPVFIAAMLAIIAYAILRYRLMDVRLLIKRSTIYFTALMIVVFSIVLFMYGLVAPLLNIKLDLQLTIAGSIAVMISIALFSFVHSLSQRLVNKLIFKKITSYQEAIKDLSNQLVTIIDLNKLVNLVVETTKKTMGLDKAGVLLRDEKTKKYEIQKIIGFKEENGISLVKDNFLTDYLEKNAKPLVYEELKLMIRDAKDQHQRQKLNKLRNNMKRIEAVVCLPLFIKGRLQGLVVLGRKLSGDAYSREDIELLGTLANQASIAVENARLYEEINKLKQGLQEKVAEQTHTIRSQLKQIQSLSRAREEFIEIASHQLRTPISGAWSFMSSFVDGSLENETKEERRKDYQKIYQAMAKLKTVVNQIIDALAVQKIGGLKLVNKKIFNVEEVLDRLLKSKTSPLKIEAEEKKIKFKIVKSPSPLPLLWADAYYFKSVLLALIDNAVKYTSLDTKKEKIFLFLMVGKSEELKDSLFTSDDKAITSFLNKDKSLLKKILSSLKEIPPYEKIFFFLVQDYGIGIPQKEQKKILQFKPFQRAKNAKAVHTDGSGLSLYLADNILKAHQGRLFLYSQGENKGTTAWFWLRRG